MENELCRKRDRDQLHNVQGEVDRGVRVLMSVCSSSNDPSKGFKKGSGVDWRHWLWVTARSRGAEQLNSQKKPYDRASGAWFSWGFPFRFLIRFSLSVITIDFNYALYKYSDENLNLTRIEFVASVSNTG